MDKEKSVKKKSIVFPIVVGSIILLVICGVITVVGIAASPTRRVQEQLDLGDRYLTELNYEQALLAYQEAINIDEKCEAAYLGIVNVYKMQAAASTTVEEALGHYEKVKEYVPEFQYTIEELEVLIRVALLDVKKANVVLELIDELAAQGMDVSSLKDDYVNLAVQYVEAVGGKSVYAAYSKKINDMDPGNLYAMYYGCIADYADNYGTPVNLLAELDVDYPMSKATYIMTSQGSEHCSVKYDIGILADGLQKDAEICGFVYNEHADAIYASWVGNIVYQDDAYDVNYTYDEGGRVLSIDAAGYTWGGGDNETLEARYSYRENGQLEKVMVNGRLYQEYRYDELDRIVYKYDNSFLDAPKTTYTYHETEGYIHSRTESIPVDWDDDGVWEEQLQYYDKFVQNTVLEDGTKINVIANEPAPTGEATIIMPDGNILNMGLYVPVDSTFAIEYTDGAEALPNAIAPGYAGDTYNVSVYDTAGNLLYVYTYIYDEYGLLERYRMEAVSETGDLEIYEELCYLTEVGENGKYLTRIEMYGVASDEMNVRFGRTCEIIYFK